MFEIIFRDCSHFGSEFSPGAHGGAAGVRSPEHATILRCGNHGRPEALGIGLPRKFCLAPYLRFVLRF